MRRLAAMAAVLALASVSYAQLTIPHTSLRVGNPWLVTTQHPAYQFWQMASRGPVHDDDCISHGGIVGGIPHFVGGKFTQLRQGVLYGKDPSRGNVISIGFGTRTWWGGTTLKACIYLVR